MRLTENPWPVALLLALCSAACAVLFRQRQQNIFRAASGLCLLLTGATFIVERAIVTDRERLEQNISLLASAFERKDSAAVLNAFSAGAGKWRDLASDALEWVTIKGQLSIKDVSVRLYGYESRAVTHFRANGTVEFKGVDLGHQPSRWELTWQREHGGWKIIDVRRLNPFSDEEMQPFEQRTH
jgi:hypothetical protein